MVSDTQLSETCTPARGMTISAPSAGGNGSRLMVRPSWATVRFPNLRLTGSSRLTFRATGSSPAGTGNVRFVLVTSWLT